MDSYANGYDYYSTYGSAVDSANAVGGLVAGMMIFVVVIVLIALVIGIIGIVGQWKMLKKAGQPGWPAIIPIYNTYMLCKISGVNPWWILIVLVGGMIGGFIPVIGPLLVCAISIYFSVLLYVSIAKSFGKDTGWAIGLYFLQPFFMFALGNGKSEYVGPKPMNDVVMNKINEWRGNNTNTNQNMNTNNNMNQSTTPNNYQQSESVDALGTTAQATSFCPGCGTKIEGDSKFCPSCGKSL